MKNAVALCFRQRHGGDRFVPAPFRPSLRLHFTFPPAEPLTEACQRPMQLFDYQLKFSSNLLENWLVQSATTCDRKNFTSARFLKIYETKNAAHRTRLIA
jgi:hypothetical protein